MRRFIYFILPALAALSLPLAAAETQALPQAQQELLHRLTELEDGYPEVLNPPIRMQEKNFTAEEEERFELFRDFFQVSYLAASGRDEEALEILRRNGDRSEWPYRMRLMEADILKRQGNIPAAEKRLTEMIEQNPERVDAYLDLARLQSNRGDSATAIQMLESGREHSPRNIELLQDLHRQYGQAYQQAKTLDDQKVALNHLEEMCEALVEARPGRPSTPYVKVLAIIKLEKNKLDEAETWMTKLVQLQPRDIANYIQLANLQQQLDRKQEAIATLRRASIVAPSDPALVKHVQVLLLDGGQGEDLLDFYRSLAEEYPGRDDIQIRYAMSLVGYTKSKEAATVLERSLAFHPYNPDGWLLLARLYAGTDEPEKACEAVEKYLARSSRTMENLLEAARFLIGLNCVEKAEAPVAEALEKSPDNTEALNLQMEIDRRLGRFENLVQRLEESLARAPNSSLAHYILAVEAFRGQGRLAEAAPILEKGIATAEPDKANRLRELLMLVHRDLGDTDSAIRVMREAVEKDSGNWKMQLALVQLYQLTGKEEELRKGMDSLLANQEENAEVQYELALVEWNGKHLDRAESMLRKAIELKPDYAEAHNSLGYLFAEQGIRLDEAIEHVEQALAMRPGAGHMIDSLGWIYFQKGNYEKAADLLEQAVQKEEGDPLVMEHLADAYRKLDRRPEALALYRQAADQAIEQDLKSRLEGKVRELTAQSAE